MNRLILISLGSNLGNRHGFLLEAQTRLASFIGLPTAVSSVYETEAIGVVNHPPYLNQVLAFESRLPAQLIFEHSLSVEKELGREEKGMLRPRNIDIDILCCGKEIIRQADLQIPHPRLHLRRFVLEPLAEIIPGWEHPLLGIKVDALLKNLQSNSDGTF